MSWTQPILFLSVCKFPSNSRDYTAAIVGFLEALWMFGSEPGCWTVIETLWCEPYPFTATQLCVETKKNMVWRTFLSNVLSSRPNGSALRFLETPSDAPPTSLYVFWKGLWTLDLIAQMFLSFLCLNCFQCCFLKAPLSVKCCIWLVDMHFWPAFSYFWIRRKKVQM